MGRFRFILRRLLQTVALMVGIVFLVFLLQKVSPGDPARLVAGLRAPPSEVAKVRQHLGLDRPVVVQFVLYLGNVVHGDLGASIRSGVPVSSLVADRLPVTLWLIVSGALLTILITLPVAAIAARRRDRAIDHAIRGVALFGLTMPSFWTGLMLLLFVALPTGWFPVGGFGETLPDKVRSIFLPALTLAIGSAPIMIRSLRSSMIDVLGSDFVAAGRSIGVRGLRLTLRFVLRNSILPMITLLAIDIGYLLFGAVVIETTFALPGLGQGMVLAASQRDFPVVQGFTLVFAVLVVIVHLLADILYVVLDPRVEIR